MTIGERLDRARDFLREGVWEAPQPSRWVLAKALGLLQFALMTGEGFVKDRLLLRASALSYFTVLSLIPMLAIVIGIASAMGLSGNFAELIVKSVAGGAPDAMGDIVERIRSARLGALGSIGAAALFLTTVLGISNIEGALNSIWGVQNPRSWGRRLPDYLTILVVVPLLLGVGISLKTTLESQWLVQRLIEYPSFSFLYDVGLKQAPLIVMSLAFAMMLWFLPNTKVSLGSAVLGGAVSGALVVFAQDVYIGYSVGAARADALFGTFAQLPLLFVWIYIFWAIVLFGAEVAFAHQNLAHYRREVRGRSATPAQRESVGLRIALEVARTFRDGRPAHGADDLAEIENVPVRTVRDVAARLEEAGILSVRKEPSENEGYQLGRPAERIRLLDILIAVRGQREATGSTAADLLVEGVLSSLDGTAREGAAGQSLAELLAAIPDPPGGGAAALGATPSLDHPVAQG